MKLTSPVTKTTKDKLQELKVCDRLGFAFLSKCRLTYPAGARIDSRRTSVQTLRSNQSSYTKSCQG